MKILYVEDNAADADLACRILARAAPQFALDVVPNLETALRRLTPSNFLCTYDLVLSDLCLPDGSGTDVLRHVRAHQLPIPVVLVSAVEDEAAIVAAFKAGADDYVIKTDDYLDRLPATLQIAFNNFKARAKRQAHPLRVLYAHHGDTDVEATQRHLAQYAGHIQIERTTSAQGLYERLSTTPFGFFQVILMDYHLPDVNGLHALKHIHEKLAVQIPVIFLAERTQAELALQALKLGASDFLVKHAEYLYRLPQTIENVHYSRQLIIERAALQASQKALIQSETQYRLLFQEYQTLLDAIPDCITLYSPDLKIAWANRAASRPLGEDLESLEGPSYCEIFMQHVHTETDCPVVQTFERGEGVHKQDVRVADRFWDIRTIPVKTDDGGMQKVICVARDVTQTRLLEQQLRQRQKMEAVGTLAGGIAHDFNNILAAIIGFDELAMQHPRLAPEIRPNLQEIFKASLRAKDLVQQIVDFSRLGKQQTLPLQMVTVVEGALKLLRPTLPSTITIETHFHCQPVVEADRNQMHQVIVNLCTNAAHAMAPEGGTLVISLEDRHIATVTDMVRYELNAGDYVCLKVQDSGHGMTPSVMERIFEPYFTTKEVGKGSGLGLAVVHGIVKGHHGAIQAESVPGQGSTFTVFLPAVVRRSTPAALSLSVGKIPGGSESILFVDDEKGLAGLGEQMLRRLGYSVKSCTNPEMALSLVQNDPKAFDLLISDLTMPRMTGLALAEGCKKVKPDLRVIICTGHSDLIPDDQAQAKRLGIRTFLQKPARLQDLASVIRGVFESD